MRLTLVFLRGSEGPCHRFGNGFEGFELAVSIGLEGQYLGVELRHTQAYRDKIPMDDSAVACATGHWKYLDFFHCCYLRPILVAVHRACGRRSAGGPLYAL